jgi:hypothetical protein
MAESPQDLKAIRLGHLRVELGTSLGTLVNLGAINNAKGEYESKEATIEADNTGEIMEVVDDETFTITGDILEINEANLQLLAPGLGTVEIVAADPVAVTDETVVLTGTGLVRLEFANAAGTEVGSIVVTNAAGAVTYDRAADGTGGDYVVVVDPQGFTCIARTADSTISTGATVLVDYSYTPASSKTMKFGGKTTKTYLVARLSHIRKSDNAVLSFTCYKVKAEGKWSIPFPAVKGVKAPTSPFKMTAILDRTRAAGDQLMAISNAQL